MPVTITNTGLPNTSSSRSGGGVKGINNRTFSEFLDLTNTLNTENYLIEAEGDLVKRLGKVLEKDITGSDAIQVFKITNDMWLLQYGTQISSYYKPTQTVTALETLSTSDDISAVKFGDYIFYTNGSSVIRYTTFGVGADLLTLTDFETTYTNNGNTYYRFWADGADVKAIPFSTGTSTATSTGVDISPVIGDKYQINVTPVGNSTAGQQEINGFFPTQSLGVAGIPDGFTEVAINTDNLSLRATFESVTDATVGSEVPTGTIDGANTVFTVPRFYHVALDVYIDGSLTPTTGCTIKGQELTVPVAPTVSIEVRNGQYFQIAFPLEFQGLTAKKQDLTILEAPETLTNSPTGTKLFIYDSRLVIGDITGDEGLVQYSERYTAITQSDIPTTFNVWTSSNNPLEPNDAGNIALRELGKVNDFFQLGSQLGILYENGKAGYRITNDGTNQVVLQDFAYEDMGGCRAITTGQGVFYINETGLWILASGGNTSQPFSSSESNPSRRVFSDEFLSSIDFTDTDLIHDFNRGLILISCKDAQAYNDLILWYNIENKSFGKITGWNVKKFMRINENIYVGDSNDTQIHLLFSGNSDNGVDITSTNKQEIQSSDLNTLLETVVKGEFSTGTDLKINFDVYDKNGTLTTDFLSNPLILTPTGGTLQFQRWAKRTNIREYSRIIMKITSTDSVPHKINLIEVVTAKKGTNRKFNA